MTELPNGTVTFILTDVEGSTGLWEEAPEAMRATLARHSASTPAHKCRIIALCGHQRPLGLSILGQADLSSAHDRS